MDADESDVNCCQPMVWYEQADLDRMNRLAVSLATRSSG
jgi:hypothetical protein